MIAVVAPFETTSIFFGKDGSGMKEKPNNLQKIIQIPTYRVIEAKI